MMEHSDQPDRGSPNGLMRPAHSDSDLISRLRHFNLNPPHYLHRHQQQQQQQPQQHEELQQTPPTRSSDSFVTPKKKKRSSRKAWLAQLNCCLTRTDSIPDLSDQQQQHGERFEMGEIPAGPDGIVLEPDAFQVAEDEAPPPTGHLARGAFNQFYSPPPLPVNPYNSPIQLPLPPPPMPGPEPIYRPIAARVDGDDSPPMVNMPPFPFAMPHDLLAAIPISFARQRLQMHHLDPVPPVSMYPPGGNFRWVRADPIHTQIDYINTLVPDLKKITNCSFYWGKMDRYEAEKLLEGKPEGTFLLRDSAQDDHLFSVSFRRFDRSLHARIEHWQHKFSFDSHDPGVFSSPTVTGLIERYKDPSHCMFFEPMLTRPLNRSHPFSLQHLARVTICDLVTYEMVQKLPLPSLLKCYLREYHYRTKVRTKHFDEHQTYLYYQPPAPPGGPPPPDHNQETNHYLELM